MRPLAEIDTMIDVEVVGKIVDKAHTYSAMDAEADTPEIRQNIVETDYAWGGTCGDERHGELLLSDEPITQAWAKAWGGPYVHGYVTALYVGWFGPLKGSTHLERFTRTASIQQASGVVGGGHVDEKALDNGLRALLQDGGLEKAIKSGVNLGTGCKAADGLKEYTEAIAADRDGAIQLVHKILRLKPGDKEVENVWQQIALLDAMHILDDWNPLIHLHFLGQQMARRIEILKGQHLGKLVNINEKENSTLNRDSMQHDAFDYDLPYVKYLQDPLATGPDLMIMKKKLLIASAFMTFGVSKVIPNEELVATRTSVPDLVRAA